MIRCTGFSNLECHKNTLSSGKHVYKGVGVSIRTPPSSHGVGKASCVLDRCASHNGCHAVIRKNEKASCRHYHQDDEFSMTPNLQGRAILIFSPFFGFSNRWP